MALVGYARVSTEDQTAAQQVMALRAAGCVRVQQETASGASRQRPELARVLETLKQGDVFVVVRIDRLARSLSHLLQIVEELDRRGIGFRSLTDPIDTTSPQGRLTLQILGAVAEFERALIAERTRAGLARAAADGRKGGNPGLRRRDRNAVRALAEAREAALSNRIIDIAGAFLPVVQAMRPRHPWREVVRMLDLRGAVRPDGQPWTVDSLIRACRRLARDGLLDPRLLTSARPGANDEAAVTLSHLILRRSAQRQCHPAPLAAVVAPTRREGTARFRRPSTLTSRWDRVYSTNVDPAAEQPQVRMGGRGRLSRR